MSEPPILVNWNRDIWLWPSSSCIKMNSLSNFLEHHLKWLQKFLMKFICYSRLLANLGMPTPLELSLNITTYPKWDETPYQNISLWDSIKDKPLHDMMHISSYQYSNKISEWIHAAYHNPHTILFPNTDQDEMKLVSLTWPILPFSV